MALQLSARGGELFCEHAGERVKIGGNAVTYLTGEIEIQSSQVAQHQNWSRYRHGDQPATPCEWIEYNNV